MNTQERAKALVDHNRTSTQIFFGAQSALLELSPPEDSEALAQSLAIRYRHGQYAPPHTTAISKRPRPRQPRVSHPPARSAPSDLIAKQHTEPKKVGKSHNEASVPHGALEASVQRAIDAVETHAVRSTQKTAHVGRETLAIVKSTKESTKNALTLAKDAPEWHAPWIPFRQISGHLGWVRSVAVDPSNHWFATGSSDRTVKIWDLASGRLKLTLTGHISAVRGLVISERHPYMFSVGEDKTVKCWDLEQNKVIRNYHGHLSGVYCASLHPTLDVLVTGGRDSTVRVWDIRTRAAVFVLPGHRDTVNALLTDVVDPQIVSASVDSTIRMWDLAAGRCSGTLTNHKKGVRALVRHPRLFSFASASADAIKTWGLPQGTFMRNLTQHDGLVNALAVNEDGVMASGGDNGTLCMWDYAAAHCFQTEKTRVQPGSLDCEAGIFAMAFDRSGSRLITCEADKTIKMWKEDEEATKETHPLNWKPNLDEKRY